MTGGRACRVCSRGFSVGDGYWLANGYRKWVCKPCVKAALTYAEIGDSKDL